MVRFTKFAGTISSTQSMLRKNIIKKVTALCCAFTVSFTGLPEINVNAQTTKVQSETEQTDSTMSKQGMVHTLATKAVSKESELRAYNFPTEIIEWNAPVNNESELISAINCCPTDGSISINLSSSFKLTKSITISGNKKVYIDGTNGSSRRAIGTNKEIACLFTVEKGSSVLFSNMILKGGTSSATDVSYRTTGAVLVANGGHIQLDNCNVLYSQGALVNIESSGSVYATDTTFSNAKGTISDCGGAVRIASGTFSMKGNSEISNNAYGGVYVSESGTFDMNGGNIYGNKVGAGHVLTASGYLNYGMGGGVFCNGTFNYSEGGIYGNSASVGGSGVVISSTGKMQVESGANLTNSGSGSNELWLYTSDVTFKNAPSVPMNTKVKFDTTFGTNIATCPLNVSANSCMIVDEFKISNYSTNPELIIRSGDFNITFEPNGAEGKKTITTKMEYNSSFQLPTDYKKTGYTLSGWKESNTFRIYEPGSTQIVLTDATYTALYKAKNVTVKFNLNQSGAKMSAGNTTTVKYDDTLQLSSYVPSATGYTFEGWYTNKSLTGRQLASVSPAKLGIDTTIELYAKWRATSSNSSSTSTTTGSQGSFTKPTTSPDPSVNTNGWLSLYITKKNMGVGDEFYIGINSNEDYEVSTNSSCITVKNSGYVKAIKPGKAVVTVKTPSVTKTCTITVKAAPKASNISVKAKKVKKGKTVSVKPVFTNNTYCMSVTYASSNKKVATVSKKGKVKGLKKGTVKITIKCSTGAKKVIKIQVV